MAKSVWEKKRELKFGYLQKKSPICKEVKREIVIDIVPTLSSSRLTGIKLRERKENGDQFRGQLNSKINVKKIYLTLFSFPGIRRPSLKKGSLAVYF